MGDYDVLICGAGISGLLLAAELSKHVSVVVLERNPRFKCSNKFWLTSKLSAELNHELKPFVDSEWNTMDFIACNRAKFTAQGEYVLWDTKRLEAHLVGTIVANGSEILYEHRFYSYRYSEDATVSYANGRTFRSSILIDCMGFSSPIVSSARAVNILGYHHLYGKVIKLKERIAPIAIDNVILSGRPSFLEVFPRSDGKANVVLIAPAETTRSTITLEQDFNFIVERSHYSDILEHGSAGESLQGVVPVGVIKTKALDRIMFFGEAGQIHPAASCTCLTRLLLQYKSVALSIVSKIQSNNLHANDLKSIAAHMNTFSERFHQNMFREIANWTSSRGEALVQLLSCLDQKSLNDFIFGEIDPSHFLQVHNLVRLLQKRNFLWLAPLLRTVFT